MPIHAAQSLRPKMFLLQRKEMPAIIALTVCVIGFSLWTLSDINLLQETTGIVLGGWEYLFLSIGSPYLINYCLVPFTFWFLLRQYSHTWRPESLIRHGTKTKWAFDQGFIALEWILLLLFVPIIIGLIISLRFPWQWEWSASLYENMELVQSDLTSTMPVLPYPAIYLLVMVLQQLFMYLEIVTIISLLTAFIPHPRTPVIAGGALFFWFVLGWGMYEIPGVAYFTIVGFTSPAVAIFTWGVSPFIQIVILITAGIIIYTVTNYLELNKEKKLNISGKFLVTLSAIGLLIGIYALRTNSGEEISSTIRLLYVLQGSSPEGLLFLDFLVVVLLVTLPAYLVQKDLVAALLGRRYQEIIRCGSASKWFCKLICQQTSFIAIYCAGCGLGALILFSLFTNNWPNSLQISLLGLWTLALFCQVLVCILILSLGTFITKKVSGSLYALGFFIVLSGPWGNISYWLPAGLPSIIRLVNLDDAFSSATINILPLLAIVVWLAIFATANLLVLKRTRAEIY